MGVWLRRRGGGLGGKGGRCEGEGGLRGWGWGEVRDLLRGGDEAKEDYKDLVSLVSDFQRDLPFSRFPNLNIKTSTP